MASDDEAEAMRPSRITDSQWLRSRGWKPGSLAQWSKRGWNVTLDDAITLQRVIEDMEISFPNRGNIDDRLLTSITDTMRGKRSQE